jgi:hypothetical protein
MTSEIEARSYPYPQYAAEQSKSYLNSAIMSFILYILFWPAGAVMNIIYLNQAKQTQSIIGREPEGKAYLSAMMVGCFWFPIALIVVGLVLYLTIWSFISHALQPSDSSSRGKPIIENTLRNKPDINVKTDKYGAIAYSHSTGRYGYGIDYSTPEAAKAIARQECQLGDCQILLDLKNSCAALAQAEKHQAIGSYGNTKSEA